MVVVVALNVKTVAVGVFAMMVVEMVEALEVLEDKEDKEVRVLMEEVVLSEFIILVLVVAL